MEKNSPNDKKTNKINSFCSPLERIFPLFSPKTFISKSNFFLVEKIILAFSLCLAILRSSSTLSHLPAPKEQPIKNNNISIIAEIKKASPSAGILFENYNPVDIAKIYFKNGATCLSVLTEEDFFLGNLSHIYKIKSLSNPMEPPGPENHCIPILCKDFFIDVYQVQLAKYYGADAILIILAGVDEKTADELYEEAEKLKMSVIVEVHTVDEAKQALRFKDALIGINNRNLKTFETSLETTTELLEHIPQSITVVTESGIRNKSDVSLMQKNQVNCFLVGETFMRSEIPGEALSDLFYS